MKKSMKLILLICLSLLTCMIMFAACDSGNVDKTLGDADSHTHTFGEWKIIQNPTYTEEGVRARYCSCGEKQNESIEKLTPQTQPLTSLECKNELQAIYDNSIAQNSMWFSEDDWVYARYFDGESWLYYEVGGKDGEWSEAWCGKYEGEYYWFYKETDSSGTATQTYEIVPQDEMDGLNQEIETFGEELLQYLEHAISLVAESTSFECLKTTGETTIYQIKLIVDNEVENITITTVNGLITVYDHDNYTTATYTYDKVITLPNKADYQMQ